MSDENKQKVISEESLNLKELTGQNIQAFQPEIQTESSASETEANEESSNIVNE